MSRARRYYPVFVDLSGKRVVVVGGGPIAARKASGVIAAGAVVTVVSPSVNTALHRMAFQQRLRWQARRFRATDLHGAWLAIAATNDAAVNRAVSRAASARRIFVNVVDHAPLCTFIAPAVTAQGKLTVAISTGGTSPTLAKLMKRQIRATLGPQAAQMARLLGGLRGVAKRRLPRYQDRKHYFEALVANGLAWRLQQEGARSARQEALALLGRFAESQARA